MNSEKLVLYGFKSLFVFHNNLNSIYWLMYKLLYSYNNYNSLTFRKYSP
jgi:hypothetical protein